MTSDNFTRVTLTIPALDEFPLGATIYLPARPRPIGVVTIHTATAVPARYYAPFASALADHGMVAITYDYRGIAASRRSSLRGFGASMRDWINLDAEGVLAWALTAYPGLPLLAVGHSLGGHAIGLCQNSRFLVGTVMVASAAAWVGFMPSRLERLRIRTLLRVLGPALVNVFGYAPLQRLGMGEDLPGPAFRDWAGWISRRHYFFDDPTMDAASRFARIRAPVLLAGAEDDPWTPAPAIDLLGSYFTSVKPERWQIYLTDVTTKGIGHAGFFRTEHRHTIWPRAINWLSRHAIAAA